MRRFATLCALCQLVVAPLVQPLAAQRQDSLAVAVGARIRVIMDPSTPPPGWMIGRYAGSDVGSLRIALPPDGDAFSIPWSEIASVEVSRSQRTGGEAFMRGAAYGVAIFGSISLVGIGAAAIYDMSGRCGDCILPASAFVVPAGVVFTAGGALLGGLIGAGFRDRWERVR
jgi:hypothetical protein